MNRRVLGVLLAVVLAIFGTAAVVLYVSAAKRTVAAGQKAVKVLVAVDRIPAGTTGGSIRSRKLVDEVVMPAASVPDDTLGTVPTELDDLVLTSDLQPRQLLLRGLFGARSKISGGLQVPDNMLAVTVKLEVEEEVGGFIRPGSRVALFGTYEVIDKAYKDAAGENNQSTRMLLPRVEVLAVGAYGADGVTSAQQQDAGQEQTKNQDGEVTLLVTVAVNQTEAERLIHSARIGGIYAALLTDSSDVRPGRGVDNTTLY